MSAGKDEPLGNPLQRSDSYKLANGHDALKRVREGEPDEELGSTNKRPDFRNPFSKTDASLDFEENPAKKEDPVPTSTESATQKSLVSSLSCDSQDSNGGNDGEDDPLRDTSTTTPRKTSTPSALMRRMSLENSRRRLDQLDQSLYFTPQGKPLPELLEPSTDSLVSNQIQQISFTEEVADKLAGTVKALSDAALTGGEPDEPVVAEALPESSANTVRDPVPQDEGKNGTEKKPVASDEALAVGSEGSPKNSSPASFVFGQNLSAKIANSESSGAAHMSGLPTGDSPSSSMNGLTGFAAAASGGGQSGFLFSDTLKSLSKDSTLFGGFGLAGSCSTTTATPEKSPLAEEKKKRKDGEEEKKKEATGETLQETANREYEAKQQKPVLEDVDVVTGEESERNVFEVTMKLYVLDKDSLQWKERGRAIARLNDAHDKSYSRLVIRMAGTLRIIINTNVWKDMSVERLSDKNVRFSAFDTTDENALKVFLISCSPDSAGQFFHELKSRIERIKFLAPASPPSQPLPVLPAKEKTSPPAKEKISPKSSLSAASTEDNQPVKKSKTQDA